MRDSECKTEYSGSAKSRFWGTSKSDKGVGGGGEKKNKIEQREEEAICILYESIMRKINFLKRMRRHKKKSVKSAYCRMK